MKRKIICLLTLGCLLLSLTADAAPVSYYHNNMDKNISGITTLPDSHYTGGFGRLNLYGNNVLRVEGGMNTAGNARYAGAMVGDADWKNYTVEFKARTDRLWTDTFFVMLGYKGSKDYYSLTWSQGSTPGYYTILDSSSFMLCENSIKGGSVTYDVPKNLNVYGWNSYRITTDNGLIEVYINDFETPVMSYEISEEVMGSVAFGVYGTSYLPIRTDFDDIKIYRK